MNELIYCLQAMCLGILIVVIVYLYSKIADYIEEHEKIQDILALICVIIVIGFLARITLTALGY